MLYALSSDRSAFIAPNWPDHRVTGTLRDAACTNVHPHEPTALYPGRACEHRSSLESGTLARHKDAGQPSFGSFARTGTPAKQSVTAVHLCVGTGWDCAARDRGCGQDLLAHG